MLHTQPTPVTPGSDLSPSRPLQDRGFTQFLRIGSLKRISKSILSHSLHQGGGGGGGDSEGNKDSLSVLKEMLKEASSEQEVAVIR